MRPGACECIMIPLLKLTPTSRCHARSHQIGNRLRPTSLLLPPPPRTPPPMTHSPHRPPNPWPSPNTRHSSSPFELFSMDSNGNNFEKSPVGTKQVISTPDCAELPKVVRVCTHTCSETCTSMRTISRVATKEMWCQLLNSVHKAEPW
jgi:hypothetical protein